MQKKQILTLMVSILIPFIIFSEECTKVTISGHPEYPPVMWKKGNKIIGVGAELAETIFTELGVSVESKYMGPWKRVQQLTKVGDVDAIVAAYITDERKTYMNYPTPYLEDPIVIFVKKEATFPFDKWEDLVGKKGVTTIGDSYGQKFDSFIDQKLNVKRVRTVELGFKRINLNRADYMIFSLFPGVIEAYRLGLHEEIVTLPHSVISEKFYMPFSKKSPCLKHIPHFNERLKELQENGFVNRLVDKYNNMVKSDSIQ